MNYDFPFRCCPENAGDRAIVKGQLGSDAIGTFVVLERCRYNAPSIIILLPNLCHEEDHPGVGRNEVFYQSASNVVWLTCPYLNDRIHELENRGYIRKISRLISSKKSYASMMKTAHASFYYLRKKVINTFIDSDAHCKADRRVLNTGIGGIRDTGNIKCLHLHYSHFRLCEQNIAGWITDRLLKDKAYCDNRTCIKKFQ